MSKRWKPGLNEIFWYINAGNKIDYTTNNGFGCDEEKIAAGNCFFTQAEAKSAAEKVKALLLSLPDNGNNLASYSPDKKPPKLTADVFNRPDCPEWAKYAAVDADGDGYYYEDKPRACEADGEWLVDKCIVGTNRIITDNFDPTDWQNSLIERPAVLPDWCKVGEWVYLCNGTYSRIASINDCHVNLENGISVGKNSIHEEMVSARLRPYNADEMRGLVGEVVSYTDKSRYFIISCADFCTDTPRIYFGETWHTAEEINKPSLYQLDNKPCGKIEHLENGEWVE